MEIIFLGAIAGAIGGVWNYFAKQENARQEKRHRSYLHSHGDWGWHEHEFHGNHVHPQGMNGPFRYVPEREH